MLPPSSVLASRSSKPANKPDGVDAPNGIFMPKVKVLKHH